jgi:Icc-related predicted phosphoesterase
VRVLALADKRPPMDPALMAQQMGAQAVLLLGDLDLAWIETLRALDLPKLGVHGNHDRGDEFDGLGIESVHLRRIELGGLWFGGFSGSNEYHAEPRYTWSQKKASKLLRKFGHVDVMLAHSPPLGVNDDAEDAAHTGLAGLREYLERERPAMLLHGHTYPPLPVERWGDTEVRHVRGHRFVTLPQSAASAL